MTTQFKVKFSDDAGDDSASETFYFAGNLTDPLAGGPASVTAAIEGLSGAAVRSAVLLPTDNTPIGLAAVSPYGCIEDKLLLKFKSATGLKAAYKVPCPIKLAFKASSDVVDTAQADVNALIASFVAVAKGSDGSALSFVSGSRVRTKRHKPK